MKSIYGNTTVLNDLIIRYSNLLEFDIGNTTHRYNDSDIIIKHNEFEYLPMPFEFGDIIDHLGIHSKDIEIVMPNANGDLFYFLDNDYFNKSISITKIIYRQTQFIPKHKDNSTIPYLDMGNISDTYIDIYNGYISSIQVNSTDLTISATTNVSSFESNLHTDRYDRFNNPNILKAVELSDFKPPYMQEF